MKKMNFTSIALRFAFLALGVFSMAINATAQQWSPCGPEKATLFLSTTDCVATLTAADLGGVATQVTIKKPGLTAKSITLPYSGSEFNNANVGIEYEIMYMGRGGYMCYTYVSVRDNAGPITTIPDAYVRCNELVNGKAPAPGSLYFGKSLTAKRMFEPKGVTDKGQLLNPYYLGSDAVIFRVDDCNNFTASYTDVAGENWLCPTDWNCYTTQIIYRDWLFKDIYGNASNYRQIIYVTKPPIVIPGVYSQNQIGRAHV